MQVLRGKCLDFDERSFNSVSHCVPLSFARILNSSEKIITNINLSVIQSTTTAISSVKDLNLANSVGGIEL
jgi:hypothetical protein